MESDQYEKIKEQLDNTMSILGAEKWKLNMRYIMTSGIFSKPFPTFFEVIFEFKNGGSFGQSSNSFSDCLNTLITTCKHYNNKNEV